VTVATAPQRTASAWDSFYADWVEPVVRFGTPALVAFVLLLVLVRVLTRVVVGVSDESGSERWHGGYWLAIAGLAIAAVDASVTLPLSFDDGYDRAVQTMLWLTIGLLVLCGLLLVVLFAQPARTRDLAVYGGALFAAFVLVGLAVYFPDRWHEPIAVAVWAVLLAAASVVVAARVRGLNIGLMIQAHNKDGADDAGLGEYVRVRLHALGSQPPRGIDLSQATDVSSLPDGALGLLPEGTLAKLGALLVQLVQPATPWRVVVCEQGDGSISVVMIRNGKVAETAVIRRSVLNLPAALAGPASNLALRTAAAAFVLLKLSERHVRLQRGLGGATDWRSVATQVIATDPSVTSADVKIELLTNAVAFDAGNLAAYAGLVAVGYRNQGTDLDYDAWLVHLLDRIDERADARDDLMAIRLRTLFNLSVIRLNRAMRDPDQAPTALVAADESATRLARLLYDIRDRRELAPLAAEIGTATWLLRASIHQLDSGFDSPDGEEPTAALSLLAYYERACLRMLQGRIDAALDDLFLATRGATMRTAARTDPSFAILHDQDLSARAHVDRFKRLVGDPVPAELFEIAPVKRRRKALERNGIRSAEQLASTTVSRLVDDVGVPSGEARVLQELAMLHGVVTDAGLVFLLLQVHIGTRAELRRRLATGEDLHADLIEAARGWAVVAPSATTARSWRTDQH
jgi:hypothetical protein